MRFHVEPKDTTIRPLPAVFFDTLDFATRAFNGIGDMADFAMDDDDDDDGGVEDFNRPQCIHGIVRATMTRAKTVNRTTTLDNPISDTLFALDIRRTDSDDAVLQLQSIARSQGVNIDRVQWDEFCAYFNIQRAD